MYISKYKDEFYSRSIPAYARYSTEQVLERTIGCEFFIIISDLVSTEIERKFPYYKENLFDDLEALKSKKKVKLVNSKPFCQPARQLNNGLRIGWADCAHLLMAKQEADVFVSWETKHKKIGKHLGITVLRPDEF